MKRERNVKPQRIVIEHAGHKEETNQHKVSLQGDAGLLQAKPGDKDPRLHRNEQELEECQDVSRLRIFPGEREREGEREKERRGVTK